MDSTATPNSSATLRSDELSSTSNDTYDTVKSEDVNEDEAVNNVESREEDREERPLDSSEVIELQAFVKHKEWIESKIKVCMQVLSFGPLLIPLGSRSSTTVGYLRWR